MNQKNNQEIHLDFKKSYLRLHWAWVIGLFVGGLAFGIGSSFLAPFDDLSDPPSRFFLIYFMLPFVIIVGLMAHRLNFLSKGDTALILSDQGITDQSSIISKGFFIPYRDIVGVKGVMLGRRAYTDLETGEWHYYSLKARRNTPWGSRPNSNRMLLIGERGAPYSISLKLVDREKYVPKRNNPIYHDGQALVYNLYCSPIDIPVQELIRLIKERAHRHYSPRKEDEYAAKLRELRSGSS